MEILIFPLRDIQETIINYTMAYYNGQFINVILYLVNCVVLKLFMFACVYRSNGSPGYVK